MAIVTTHLGTAFERYNEQKNILTTIGFNQPFDETNLSK